MPYTCSVSELRVVAEIWVNRARVCHFRRLCAARRVNTVSMRSTSVNFGIVGIVVIILKGK